MKNMPKWHVKKQTLLAIARTVWLLAGGNVTRLGLLAYGQVEPVRALHLFLSLVVFAIFGSMFYRMSLKHAVRIRSYPESTRAFWHFFDLKSYAIMGFMMGGGIWLRGSGLVPPAFIAVFYTGLGLGLAGAGLQFWRLYFKRPDRHEPFWRKHRKACIK